MPNLVNAPFPGSLPSFLYSASRAYMVWSMALAMLRFMHAIIGPARSWPCKEAMDTARLSSGRMNCAASASCFMDTCGLVMWMARSGDVRLKGNLPDPGTTK